MPTKKKKNRGSGAGGDLGSPASPLAAGAALSFASFSSPPAGSASAAASSPTSKLQSTAAAAAAAAAGPSPARSPRRPSTASTPTTSLRSPAARSSGRTAATNAASSPRLPPAHVDAAAGRVEATCVSVDAAALVSTPRVLLHPTVMQAAGLVLGQSIELQLADTDHDPNPNPNPNNTSTSTSTPCRIRGQVWPAVQQSRNAVALELPAAAGASWLAGSSGRRLLVSSLSPSPSTPSANQAAAASPPSESPAVPVSPAASGAFAMVGGLKRQLAEIQEMLELPLQQPELFRQFGLRPPRGVLLVGPPGTGKTLIARAAGAAVGVRHFAAINGSEIMSKYLGETEARLRQLWRQAEAHAPALLFIDEIDALCPARDGAANDSEKRVVAALLTLMDGSSGSDGGEAPGAVLVVGATNRPDALDAALRRPGRFDREIEIGIPSAAERRDILRVLLQATPHAAVGDDELAALADRAHGYVGADLAAVCKEAGVRAVRRCVKQQEQEQRLAGLGAPAEPSSAGAAGPAVTAADLAEAMRMVQPSAMREVAVEVPQVRWEDIGGQQETKQQLREAVEWPLQHAQAFARMGITPPRGVLLYGPPGCSKTMMAKAIATESGLNFLAVKGPELFSKWVGESEKAVREVFRKARAAAPAAIFFDEIDALGVRRGGGGGGNSVAERVLTQLLTEMDGIERLVDVTIVAATNRPDILDPALLRPGRFDRLVYVAPPDAAARQAIFGIRLRGVPLAVDVDLATLAAATDGFSGADIAAVCREAGLQAMSRDVDVDCLLAADFHAALAQVRPSISRDMLDFYERFRLKRRS